MALDKTVAQSHLETPAGISTVEEQPSRFMPGLVIVGVITAAGGQKALH